MMKLYGVSQNAVLPQIRPKPLAGLLQRQLSNFYKIQKDKSDEHKKHK
jgi:hypothetical protein